MKFEISHRWNLTYGQAVALQNDLKSNLILKNRLPKKITSIAGIDLSYSKASDELYASIVTLKFPDMDIVQSVYIKDKARFPYIPGLLSFREGPVILKALKKLENVPDIMVFDGHGIAHPRGLGIASHIGILLGVPTIGCAKSKLFGSFDEPGKKAGMYSTLKDNLGKTIGCVVRTRDNVKPIFVSPGHMIDVQTARRIIMKCTGKYRIPIPTRMAHIKSNLYRLKEKK